MTIRERSAVMKMTQMLHSATRILCPDMETYMKSIPAVVHVAKQAGLRSFEITQAFNDSEHELAKHVEKKFEGWTQ